MSHRRLRTVLASALTATFACSTVYLPQDEAYSLEVGKLGFDSMGGILGGNRLTFEPGR